MKTKLARTSEKIHEIRLAGKKARAILKLISPETSPEAAKLHERIRKMSHKLSKARDGAVVVDTIEKLAKGDEVLERAAPRSFPLPSGPELKRMSDELRKIGADIASLASTDATGPNMRRGLFQTYARVRRLYEKCREGGTPEKFHEWRRRAKDLLFQIETLAPVPSKREKKWIDGLKRLSDCLGELHDLALTVQVLDTRRTKVGKLKRRAKRKYSKIERKVVRLGKEFFRQEAPLSATFA